MAYEISVEEIAEGWIKLVRKIMSDGREIRDERGSLTREVMNTVVTIKNPLGRSEDFYHLPARSLINIRVPEGYFWSGEKLEKYSEQFLSDDRKGFVYTYGNRLRAHFGVDQVDRAIERLKNCKESRRATMVTWDPKIDTESDEVPCMILVDFKVRDGRLFTTALWRSHDIYGAWFPNAVGLAYLADHVASEVGVEVGHITIHSISAHIYEVNFKEAKEVIENG
ncbi:thymidylate synthase [Methanothermobacter sp. K4]|uniref:thymidylate synthase n=1 Tax=Methanothermobacter sp. K4 TaxID=2913262 RepID=UPI001EDC0A94|nr:thymidylate synthase [Methanothermobacter sp. K4]MCG2828757.1 thymidylate synthase [Methanothermobacter sp. K4]